jgi:hypothetical protein
MFCATLGSAKPCLSNTDLYAFVHLQVKSRQLRVSLNNYVVREWYTSWRTGGTFRQFHIQSATDLWHNVTVYKLSRTHLLGVALSNALITQSYWGVLGEGPLKQTVDWSYTAHARVTNNTVQLACTARNLRYCKQNRTHGLTDKCTVWSEFSWLGPWRYLLLQTFRSEVLTLSSTQKAHNSTILECNICITRLKFCRTSNYAAMLRCHVINSYRRFEQSYHLPRPVALIRTLRSCERLVTDLFIAGGSSSLT